MKLLLDSHTLLWYSQDIPTLSPSVMDMLQNPENDLYVSIATFYEIAIKINHGKLKIIDTVQDFYIKTIEAGIHVLPVLPIYLDSYISLPVFPDHRDPFDRLIIATAITENHTIITIDKKFELYNDIVKTYWN